MPQLPPSPPAHVWIAEIPPSDLRSLIAQSPQGQAADLQTTDLQPRDRSVPVGGVVAPGEEVFLSADSQEYEEGGQIFLASGNVRLRFKNIELTSDTLRVDLKTRIAVAEGSPKIRQGDQILVGTRLEYNFAQRKGVLFNAQGTIDTKTVGTEITPPLGSDLTLPLSADPNSPLSAVGGVVRFKAERLNFDPEGWVADNLRVTPDQFDPPELELLSPRAALKTIDANQSRLNIDGGSLLFDQNFNLPAPFYTNILDNRKRKAPNEFGSDSFDKGGIYYQQNFYYDVAKNAELTLSPQFYIQRALSGGNVLDGSNVGLQVKLNVNYGDGQLTRLFSEVNGLVFDDLNNRTRFRLEHLMPLGNHTLTLNYSFRERFFNGPFFFQTVQSSYGATIDSPFIPLGDTGIRLTYQASYAYIRANSDRPNLPGLPELPRFRVATALSKTIPIIEGPYAPYTKEYLRYSFKPVVPGLWVDIGTNYTQSWYGNGDTQSYLTGYVNLRAVIGRFSKDFFDYTSLNVGYNNGIASGSSPFLADRIGTFQQINLGVTQQLYGPFRIGIQTLFDPNLNRTLDTYYTLSFDHRTYSLAIIYNSVRQTGGIQLRIDEFNWGTNPYGRPDQVTDVVGGVERFNRLNGPGNP
jgi:hypothetical protein